ncbi:MAG: metal ABC transporter substrate-binding protein [Spirochaetaceae bacterium]|nr:metal ABC transporter substrate-binding protein [Spirochaetaceae bacterium]
MHIRLIQNATLVVALALATPYLFASPAQEQPSGDAVLVVATTTIVGDIVAGIGGDRISLYVMLAPGVDPHVFQPTPRDLRHVADADVLFANGAGLEADFLGSLLETAEPRRMVEVSAHLPLRRMDDVEEEEHDEEPGDGDEEDHHDEEDEEDGEADDHGEDGEEEDHHGEEEDHHGEFDAHVWMDPTLVAGWTVEIAEALAEVDPEHAAEYAARAATLSDELQELDAWIRSRVSAVPAPLRVLVTDHDVLSYFADRYGFELLETVVPGVSTASEPSARHLAQLRETIAEHGIPAIFIGTTVSPQTAQTVADDLGIELVAIYTGSLSEPGGPAATYQDFMRTNVERIVAALAP